MEKIFEQTLLYDFYGELLNSHQRMIYEDAVYNDMSLSEIAEEQGISRQGVHDLLKRCDKILQDYESKLHLVERFSQAKEQIAEIVELTNLEESRLPGDVSPVDTEALETGDSEIKRRMRRIRELSGELLKKW